jgi:FkbM family methyltransferase
MNKLPSVSTEFKKGIAAFLKRWQTHNADPIDVYFAYRLLLERQPEKNGWQNWCKRVQHGLTREMLRTSFLMSAEYRTQHDPDLRQVLIETERFQIYVDLDDLSVSRPISQHKQYEPHLSTFLQRELRPDMHFLDIGANIGWFTLLAASLLPDGRVIAVEPNIYNVQLLNRSLVTNQFHHVTVYPFAATDAAAILPLSFIGSNGRIQQLDEVTPHQQFVQGLPLDHLLPPTTKIDVMKIDIEGYEWVAFKGMTRLLQQNRPLIVTEFHPQAIRQYTGYVPENYLQTLFDFEYTVGVLMPDGTVQTMPDRATIMAHWQSVNQQAGLTDELHLDLVARPFS